MVTTTGAGESAVPGEQKNQNQNQTFDNNSKTWRISCVLVEQKPKQKPNQTKPLATTPRAGGISCNRGAKPEPKPDLWQQAEELKKDQQQLLLEQQEDENFKLQIFNHKSPSQNKLE